MNFDKLERTQKGAVKLSTLSLLKQIPENGIIRPSRWNGSPNHLSLIDKAFDYKKIFDAIGVKYKSGNDAPKGGRNGDYIKIRKDTAKKLVDFAKNYER